MTSDASSGSSVAKLLGGGSAVFALAIGSAALFERGFLARTIPAVLLVTAAVLGFLALRRGASGAKKLLALALCVVPMVVSVAYVGTVYLALQGLERATATATARTLEAARKGVRQAAAKKKTGQSSTTAGPPPRVAANPSFAHEAPVAVIKSPSAAVVRAAFHIASANGGGTFTKGTWFFVQHEKRIAAVTAGHLFGPFSGLDGVFKMLLTPTERGALQGQIHAVTDGLGAFGGPAFGIPLGDDAGDIAAFDFTAGMAPNGDVTPLRLAAVPPPGAPVWLAHLDASSKLRLAPAIVAAQSPVVVAYLSGPAPNFDGVSGAPLVDGDGNVVAVFIGKSAVAGENIIVGTPVSGLATTLRQPQ